MKKRNLKPAKQATRRSQPKASGTQTFSLYGSNDPRRTMAPKVIFGPPVSDAEVWNSLV